MRNRQLVLAAKKAAEDKKALDPVILNMGKYSSVAAYFLIVHGTSDRHVKSIAEHIEFELSEQKEEVWHLEGLKDGRWVLLDYGAVVVHVFHHEARRFYNLERLWGKQVVRKVRRKSK